MPTSEHQLSDEELNNVAGGGCSYDEADDEGVMGIATCPSPEWTHWVYSGIGAASMIQGRHCFNCHSSFSAK